jgi:hypothetical protein
VNQNGRPMTAADAAATLTTQAVVMGASVGAVMALVGAISAQILKGDRAAAGDNAKKVGKAFDRMQGECQALAVILIKLFPQGPQVAVPPGVDRIDPAGGEGG